MTKAICGVGTIVELDGICVREVFSIRLKKEGIEVCAFFVPNDPVHKCILEKIRLETACSLGVRFPGNPSVLQCSGTISGEANIVPSDAAKLLFLITGEIEIA